MKVYVIPCEGEMAAMASGKWGTVGTCAMRQLHSTSSASQLTAKPPSSIVFSTCCSRFVLLPSTEVTICCFLRGRRWSSRSPWAIACMQNQRNGDQKLHNVGRQSLTLRSNATLRTRASSKHSSQHSEMELQCIGTGLDVECVILETDLKSASDGNTFERSQEKVFGQTSDVDCIGTGTNVECVIPDSSGSVSSNKKVAARAATFVKSKAGVIDLTVDSSSKTTFFMNEDDMQEQGLTPFPLLKDTWEYLVLISPFFFWGTAMVAMKGVLPKAGPLFVAATRLIPSGFLLIAFARFQGRKQPSSLSAWLSIALFALVDASCFQGFLAEGLKRTSAGLGSVIIDSQPLTVAVLASLLFGETLGALGVLGLATGVIGLLLLEVPTQAVGEILKGHGLSTEDFSAISTSLNNWSIWDSGEWWMLLAAQSMAVGTVMVRWLCQFTDPVMATGWHMVLGGIPLLALAGIQHDPALAGHIEDLELFDWLALVYTSIFGSAVSYGVFFYNASRGSLTKLSSLTFLTPMFAALFGYLFLQETLNETQLVGACITLASIYLINKKTSSNDEDDLV